MQKRKPICEILAIIVDNANGKKIIKMLNEQNVNLQIATMGSGTADSNFGEIFNLEGNAKDVLLSMINLNDKKNIMDSLSNIFEEGKVKGVAFTLPIKSAMSNVVEMLLSSSLGGKNE
jgi:hypothetical protein